MTKLPHADSFKELKVYQDSLLLAGEVFDISNKFPGEEMYSLTNQIRRSSRSIGGQIAESWAKRRYERYFVSKLTDADGELQERPHWIAIATNCGYLNKERAEQLELQCKEIGRMLGGMMVKSHLFCGTGPPSTHELISAYLVNEFDDH